MTQHGRAAALLFVVSLFTFPTSAQHQFPAGGETIDVSIVNLDVFVTDRRGRRVHGLTPDDFEVRENGAIQPISNFTEYVAPPKGAGARSAASGGPAPGGTPARDAAPSARRTIVIFVDVVRMPSLAVRQVFASLREFARQAVRPGDAVAVVSYRHSARMLQPYTDDPKAIEAALTLLERESLGPATDDAVELRRAEAADQAAAMNLTERELAGRAERLSWSALERGAQSFVRLIRLRRKARAITSVLETMTGDDGKKLMILAMHAFGLKAEDVTGGFTIFQPDEEIEVLRQSLVRTANANGVTLYPVSPRGMQSTTVTALEERPDIYAHDADQDLLRSAADNTRQLNETSSLSELAAETGGLSASGPRQIASLLPRIGEDLESYYSLAYRIPAEGSDKRRAIVVTAKDRRYRVRTRRSVVGKTDDVEMQDRVMANLFQPVEGTVLPFRVEIGAPTRVTKSTLSIPLVVHIPVASLTTQSGQGSFTVFVGTGGELAFMNAVKRGTRQHAIKDGDLTGANELTFRTTVQFDDSSDRISIGIRDDVSKEYGLMRMALPKLVSESGRR